MAYTIIAEQQIERINQLLRQIEGLEDLPHSTLHFKPDPNSWSILEVLDHLNVSYELYLKRIDTAVAQLSDIQQPHSEFKAGWLNGHLIKSLKPRGDQRRFKMKTLSRFTPVKAQGSDHSDEAMQEIFTDFYRKYEHLKSAVKACRYKDCQRQKIASAIGPLVRFYLPEAFEFLLVHAERHRVQITEILKVQSRITVNQ